MQRKGPKPDQGKRRAWQKRIREWRRSGLSRRVFCERENISPHALDYYRYQLKLDPGVGLGGEKRSRRGRNGSRFLQIRQDEGGSGYRATVIFPSGVRIEIHGIDLAELKKFGMP